MSFENCYKLGKIYKEVVGIRNIDHFCLNVVDDKGKLSIFSYNPQIAYNIFRDGSYLYNGSLSSTYYENKNLYSWDETYDPYYSTYLKNTMERKNGISKGIVLTTKQDNRTLLFSFATKKNAHDFVSDITEYKEFYMKIGFNCYEQIKTIIDLYA